MHTHRTGGDPELSTTPPVSADCHLAHVALIPTGLPRTRLEAPRELHTLLSSPVLSSLQFTKCSEHLLGTSLHFSPNGPSSGSGWGRRRWTSDPRKSRDTPTEWWGGGNFPLSFGNKNISYIPVFTWKSVAKLNVLCISVSKKAGNVYKALYILSI